MKLLLAEDSIQLSKRDEFMTILDPPLMWFTDYTTAAPSRRILEKKILCTIASSHRDMKTVVACRAKDGTFHEVARNTGS
jgi:hypothetical protein